jgi:hypothetical protein
LFANGGLVGQHCAWISVVVWEELLAAQLPLLVAKESEDLVLQVLVPMSPPYPWTMPALGQSCEQTNKQTNKQTNLNKPTPTTAQTAQRPTPK